MSMEDELKVAIPLPDLPPRLQNSKYILGAYPQILEYERVLQTAYNREPSAERRLKLMYISIIGYLILEGYSDAARVAVALEVLSCNGEEKEEKFLNIGKLYFEHFIRAFRMNKGRTPLPSSHASRPSFDARKWNIMTTIIEAPQNHQHAKSNALIRDNFRCVVTGHLDFNAYPISVNRELEQPEGDSDSDPPASVSGHGHGVCCTQCAHIFPESTNANVSGSTDTQTHKLHYAASVWAILDRFGARKVVEELNGSGIHRLQNILTLDPSAHYFFDTLRMWFEAVEGKANTYKLCAAGSAEYIHQIPYYKKIVTFTTPDPVKLPLPSETYLGLHAACCRVANLSGAGEYMEKILRDMEEIQVLSQDGTSAEVLQYALWPLSQQISVY